MASLLNMSEQRIPSVELFFADIALKLWRFLLCLLLRLLLFALITFTYIFASLWTTANLCEFLLLLFLLFTFIIIFGVINRLLFHLFLFRSVNLFFLGYWLFKPPLSRFFLLLLLLGLRYGFFLFFFIFINSPLLSALLCFSQFSFLLFDQFY